MVLVWAPNWYLTYHYWPTAYNQHVFEGTLYFVPPKTATERVRQELAAVTFKEYALQDANTLEATQTMLEARAVSEFPLNDQEILLRHLHATAGSYVAEYQRLHGADIPGAVGRVVTEDSTMRTFPDAFVDLEPFSGWALQTEGERYAKRLSSSMDELQGIYDAAFPRLQEMLDYLDGFELRALPDEAMRLLWLCYSLVNASFPVEVWRQARGSTVELQAWTL